MIDFLVYLFSGKHFLNEFFLRVTEIFVLLILPFIFLSLSDFGLKNECCRDSAFFSPAHTITIYSLIIICLLTYFYLSYRESLLTPATELLLNTIILGGIILNVFIAIQVQAFGVGILGNGPIIILFLYILIKNHKLWKQSTQNDRSIYQSKLELVCWRLLNWKFFQKLPILLLLCLPVLVAAMIVLMLFGQKPDSFILAFTDTYKHGLSELDCTGVICPDGHFLCTIAASGHQNVVKPLRKGIRQECLIKVNRQLLIANAFEDLLEEKLPYLHKPIRRTYNLIGGNFARLYRALSNKWLSDLIYIMMKPLEWIFLASLYLLDRTPENRIAKQYLFQHHRRAIDLGLKNVRR